MKEPVFNHTAHKELWDWLSKNPDDGILDWHGWQTGRRYDSFCCEYVGDLGFNARCEKCPVDCTKQDYIGDDCFNGLFEKFFHAKTKDDRKKYAEQIRDLPVKEGVKCI